MKTLLPWLCLAMLAVTAAAEEPSTPPAERPDAPVARGLPWIGFDVGQLDAATRAHAPQVPKGAGFLVMSVVEGGPADEAGIRPYDIVWRLGDQLLVNEAQLAVLLQLHQPADEVRVTLVRSGEVRELGLTLGVAPASGAPRAIPAGPTSMPGPVSRVYPQDRTAEIVLDDGSMARLWHQGDRPFVKITGAEGELIYEGGVRENGESKIPEEWRCTVGALFRGLYRAERSDQQGRRPRPRVVTPPSGGGG